MEALTFDRAVNLANALIAIASLSVGGVGLWFVVKTFRATTRAEHRAEKEAQATRRLAAKRLRPALVAIRTEAAQAVATRTRSSPTITTTIGWHSLKAEQDSIRNSDEVMRYLDSDAAALDEIIEKLSATQGAIEEYRKAFLRNCVGPLGDSTVQINPGHWPARNADIEACARNVVRLADEALALCDAFDGSPAATSKAEV